MGRAPRGTEREAVSHLVAKRRRRLVWPGSRGAVPCGDGVGAEQREGDQESEYRRGSNVSSFVFFFASVGVDALGSVEQQLRPAALHDPHRRRRLEVPAAGLLGEAVRGAFVGGKVAKVDGRVAAVFVRLDQHIEGVVGVRIMCVAKRVPGYRFSNRSLNASSGRLLSVYQASSNSSGRSLSDGATTEEIACSPASLSCPASRSRAGVSASM